MAGVQNSLGESVRNVGRSPSGASGWMRATSTGIAAGLAAAGSSLDRRSAVVRAIAAMQFDEQRTRNCSNRGTGSELRISDAGAQTRIVSGGPVGQTKRRLSRHLKYMAGARIPEFESYHP